MDQVDPLALKVEARSKRKSMGRLTRLIKGSLTLVWSAGPRQLLGLIALQVVGGLAMAAQILAVQLLLSAVLRAVEDDGAVSAVLLPAVLLATLTAVAGTVTAVQAQLQRVLAETVALHMWDRVLGVATGVGLRHFESPDFYNKLNRVQTSAMSRPFQVTQGLLTMAGGLIASAAVGLALASVSPWLLPVVIVGGLPVLLTSRRQARMEFEFAVGQTPDVRLRAYLTLLQTGQNEAKEVRAFGLGGWLGQRFHELYEKYLLALRSHVGRITRLTLLGQAGSGLLLVAALLVLVYLVVRGGLGLADAGAAIVAVRILASQLQLLLRGVQSIFESGLFLDDLAGFLAMGSAVGDEESGVEAPAGFSTITVRDLRFRYPRSDMDALQGIDLELSRGDIIAIVGENGSGKTTLAKLLAGLYAPDSGLIAWDDVATTTMRPASLRQRVTVVFQDFVRYALPARENIAIGAATRLPDADRVRLAARVAGVEDLLAGLPNGFDTVLSTMFAGGRDLSGGQWQRVAMARSFYRDAPLVILDEPSASLDPRAEHRLFQTLRATLHGRTAVFISHRFATVRGADRIYVLHEGRVVEQGTHCELSALGGRYAELYNLQANAFVSDAVGTDLKDPADE